MAVVQILYVQPPFETPFETHCIANREFVLRAPEIVTMITDAFSWESEIM